MDSPTDTKPTGPPEPELISHEEIQPVADSVALPPPLPRR